MASTRNKNTTSDYCLQQRSYRQNMQYNLYEHSASGSAAGTSAFPCVGTNMGHMPWNVLAQNPVDIESGLFGIDSTNLVNPRPPTIAHVNALPDISFFPRKPLHMPKPLVIPMDQRPFPIPE